MGPLRIKHDDCQTTCARRSRSFKPGEDKLKAAQHQRQVKKPRAAPRWGKFLLGRPRTGAEFSAKTMKKRTLLGARAI